MFETITRQQVIELVETLPLETLPELAQFAEFLLYKTHPRNSFATMLEEQALLEIIQRPIAPASQQRLDALREKNETRQISEAERTELFALVEQIENADAERAEALLDLARLRRQSVSQVIHEFPPNHWLKTD
ncbi:MAG: hypothetical protein HZC40_17640 [Chloroflexi bacterium]|nr:hypothetical protein [Chloroflexota bacterium]